MSKASDLEMLEFLARVQCEAHRYNDALATIDTIASSNANTLTTPTQHLLHQCIHGLFAPLRTALRKLDALILREESTLSASSSTADPQHRVRHAKLVRDRTRDSLLNHARSSIQLLDRLLDRLRTTSTSTSTSTATATANATGDCEASVAYLTLRGDLNRYMAEALDHGVARRDAAQAALIAYKSALIRAHLLSPMHPLRLALVLNAAVCYYELIQATSMARRLVHSHLSQIAATAGANAQKLHKGIGAADEAMGSDDDLELDEDSDLEDEGQDLVHTTTHSILQGEHVDQHKESKRIVRSIVKLLRRNLALWDKEQKAADTGVSALTQS